MVPDAMTRYCEDEELELESVPLVPTDECLLTNRDILGESSALYALVVDTLVEAASNPIVMADYSEWAARARDFERQHPELGALVARRVRDIAGRMFVEAVYDSWSAIRLEGDIAEDQAETIYARRAAR